MSLIKSPSDLQVDAYRFSDDGRIPNNDKFPLLIYREVLNLHGRDPAASVTRLFGSNNWTGAWRNGIYTYDHFHVVTHEVLGIVRGHVRVRFGGQNGLAVELSAGDVIVIPVGVGHKNLGADRELLVVGAYPDGREPDICTGTASERRLMWDTMAQVPVPSTDPVFGERGPLIDHWVHAPLTV